MTNQREGLPQLSGDGVFVTDGGLETELVFHDGTDLPCFAAFPLLEQPTGRERLRRYYDGYLDIARAHRAGFVVETPTWRANPDWAGRLGYSLGRLDDLNRAAVALAEEVRAAATADGITAVVSGCIGPRGDGYDPAEAMTSDDAERYHAVQIAHVRRHHRRPGDRDDDHKRRRGDGYCARGFGGGHSARDLLHGGDGREASDGSAAA